MQHSIVLSGHGFRLEPLALGHAEALAAAVDEELWAGFVSSAPVTADAYRDYIRRHTEAPGTVAFVVVDEESGAPIGSTSLYELTTAQERVEIGSTWYARGTWGSRVNPAAKLLLFTHAFEELGMWRVALRCDARNARSRAAIERLGAEYEGRLRGHRVAADGSRQDTLYYSVLRPEWPAVRRGLARRLGDRSVTR